jgi:glycosyltransferase involved in cell wall biosynthesis
MKIIYLHQYYHNPSMSGSTRSYEMARRLVTMGHEVHLITSTRGYNVSNKITFEEGIFVHWIKVDYSNRMSFYRRLYSFFAFAILSFIYSIRIKGDVLFATSTPLTIALPGVAASKWLKIPFFFEVRDLWPTVPIAMGLIKNNCLIYATKKLELFAYNNAQSIVALSDDMKEGIVKLGVNQAKVSVIPNACDLNLFNHVKNNKDVFRKKYGFGNEIIILYPGTIGIVNHVEWLVKLGFELKANSKFKIVVVGDGIEKDKVLSMAHNLKVLGENFFIIDSVSKSSITEYFEMADFIISTILPIKELEANSANKFFDALSSGTPVLVNHGGWQAELIKNKNCGIQLPFDVSKAAKLLEGINEIEETILKMGFNARKLAEEKFSRDKLASQLEQILIKK